VLAKLCLPRMNLSAHLPCLQTPGPMCKASMLRTNDSYVSARPTSKTLLESRSHSSIFQMLRTHIKMKAYSPLPLKSDVYLLAPQRRAQQSEETRAYGVHLRGSTAAFWCSGHQIVSCTRHWRVHLLSLTMTATTVAAFCLLERRRAPDLEVGNRLCSHRPSRPRP
jgi:hypothetical protein